ncbi:hypothetical protein [Streptomyces sp. NRRL S-244]|uniref:hypothetical protein n=1 Tax=Streptomyces sp. NRRL S-244 TaxID=1463897 RepID=UPI00068B2246|nr:hypothetical protein [Streptomyces sp. NRRL S-244]
MQRHDPGRATAAALAAFLLLGGCGSATGTPAGPAPEATAGPAAAAAPAAPPAPAREPSPADTRLLERAEQILISRCMDGRGFPYAVTEAPDDTARSFPYGVDDIEWARAHGYGGRDQRAAAQAREADPNQRYFRGLSASGRAAARTALMGSTPVGLSATAPTGMTITASAEGCIADAERTLYGDLATWFRVKVVTMNLGPVREARVHEDGQYAQAVGQWAACMRAAGRPYANPDASRQAAARFGESMPPAEADAAEAELAVVEATCAAGTPLARVSQALDHTYGERLRAQHQEEIALRWRLQNGALPKARQVSEKHSSEQHDTAPNSRPSGGSHA